MNTNTQEMIRLQEELRRIKREKQIEDEKNRKIQEFNTLDRNHDGFINEDDNQPNHVKFGDFNLDGMVDGRDYGEK